MDKHKRTKGRRIKILLNKNLSANGVRLNIEAWLHFLKNISARRQSNLFLHFLRTLKFSLMSLGMEPCTCVTRKCLPIDEDEYLCSSNTLM